MSHTSSQVILEAKYSAIQPPECSSLSPEDVLLFIERYDRYRDLHEKSGVTDRKLVSMLDCVSAKLRRFLEFKKPKVLEGDEVFKAYLEECCALSETTEISEAFSRLAMNMSIANARARLADYEMRFLDIKERCKVKLRDRALIDAYVAGIRPASVRIALERMVRLREVTLSEVVEAANDKIDEEEESFKLHKFSASSSARLDRVNPTSTYQSAYAKTDRVKEEHREQGHVSAKAPEPRTAASQTQAAERPRREFAGKCRHCGAPWTKEHWAECDRKFRESRESHPVHQVYTSYTPPTSEKSHEKAREKPIYLPVEVGKYHVEAEVDSGAARSCLSATLANKLTSYIAVEYSPTADVLEMADSNRCATRNVSLQLKLPSPTVADGVMIRWTFVELPDKGKEKMLIGRDLLRELGYLRDDSLTIDLSNKNKTKDREEAMSDELDDSVFDVAAVDSLPPDEDSSGEAQVKLVKVPDSPISVAVRTLLLEHCEVFDANLPEEGADVPPFHIGELTRDEVVNFAPRVIHNPEKREAVKKLIEEWKTDKLYEDTQGPWAQCIVVVCKGQKIRVCGDYRILNSITPSFIFPLPDIRVLLHAAAGAMYYAKFDLRSGFMQIKMYAGDIEKTAIITPDHHVKSLRLPFGLKNAPTFFQEQMQIIFHDLLYVAMFIFIDDFVIFGHTPEKFLANLGMFLSICGVRNLRLKAPKCEAGCEEVPAVGYVVSSKGKRMSAERVQAVQELKAPRNLHELWSVLGTLNYFREFISHCAEIEEPLNQLLQKGKEFVWTSECQTALDKLKAAITDEDILAYGTEAGQLVLKSDASSIGIGGVLVIRADGHDRPVAYYSKTLSKVQRHWATIELELYSIVFGVTQKCYTDILKLRKFLIETDHRNLVFLESLADTNEKIMRWKMFLMSYDFDIIHVPGKTNVCADMLSRIGHEEDLEEDQEILELDVDASLTTRIQLAQDPFMHVEEWKKAYFYDDETKLWYNKENLIVIPAKAEEIKREIFHAAHGHPLTGHLGLHNTVAIIKHAGYYWPNIVTDVRSYIAQCGVCQKTRDLSDPSIEMKTTAESLPFYSITIDAIGPLPEDKLGNQYIQTIMCKYTRVVKLVATHSTTAVEAADAIVSRVFLEHGLPHYVQSDNGSQYANEVVDSLLEKVHVHHHHSIPYHPQGNGIVERCNHEVMKHLRCLLLDVGDVDDWSKLLPFVEYIVNHTVHSALGVSPHVMLFGDGVLQCTNPLDFFKTPEASVLFKMPEMQVDPKNYVDALTKRLLLIHRSALKKQEAVVKKRLEKNNSRDPLEYKPGDFVLLVPILRKAKLETTLEGPYKVIERQGDVTYMLQSLVDPTKTVKTHPERMRLFMTDDTTEEEMCKYARYDKNEYKVQEIQAHRGTTKKTIEFLVHWEGYSTEDDSWEPLANVDGCDKLEDYLDQNQEAKKIVRGDKTRKTKKTHNKD